MPARALGHLLRPPDSEALAARCDLVAAPQNPIGNRRRKEVRDSSDRQLDEILGDGHSLGRAID